MKIMPVELRREYKTVKFNKQDKAAFIKPINCLKQDMFVFKGAKENETEKSLFLYKKETRKINPQEIKTRKYAEKTSSLLCEIDEKTNNFIVLSNRINGRAEKLRKKVQNAYNENIKNNDNQNNSISIIDDLSFITKVFIEDKKDYFITGTISKKTKNIDTIEVKRKAPSEKDVVFETYNFTENGQLESYAEIKGRKKTNIEFRPLTICGQEEKNGIINKTNIDFLESGIIKNAVIEEKNGKSSRIIQKVGAMPDFTDNILIYEQKDDKTVFADWINYG